MGGLGGGCSGGLDGAEKRGNAGRLLLGSSGAGMLGSAFGPASGALGSSGICARGIILSHKWPVLDAAYICMPSRAISYGRLRSIADPFPECHVPAHMKHRSMHDTARTRPISS